MALTMPAVSALSSRNASDASISLDQSTSHQGEVTVAVDVESPATSTTSTSKAHASRPGSRHPSVHLSRNASTASLHLPGNAADASLRAVNSDKLLLEAVLNGERKFPLDRASFLAFLESERALELGHFYVDARMHAKLSEQSMLEQASAQAQFVTEHYIREEADEQINLSAEDRQRIMADALTRAADPTLFDTAIKETLGMLKGGAFARFLRRALHQNITDEEARLRYAKGSVWFFVAALVLGALIACQLALPNTVMSARWWRAVLVVPLSFAFTYSVSAVCRVRAPRPKLNPDQRANQRRHAGVHRSGVPRHGDAARRQVHGGQRVATLTRARRRGRACAQKVGAVRHMGVLESAALGRVLDRDCPRVATRLRNVRRSCMLALGGGGAGCRRLASGRASLCHCM